MRGIIMLEGPDCGGKTTLAEALVNTVESYGGRAKIAHMGYTKGQDSWAENANSLIAAIRWAFSTPGGVIVLDRQFIGESIYGCVYRGGSAIPLASRHLDRLLYRFRALRVLCIPPKDVVIGTHARLKLERHEAFDDISDTVHLYHALWDGCSITPLLNDYVGWLSVSGGVADRSGWYKYDWTVTPLQEQVDLLLQELMLEQDMIFDGYLDWHEFTFTGFPKTRGLLFIGDKISCTNELNLPFFSNSASSLYLAKTLHELQLDEAGIAIANINDDGGKEQMLELVENVDFAKIIVLGKEAERTMIRESLPFTAAVRHPQHARRFNFHDDSYVEELRAALGIRSC